MNVIVPNERTSALHIAALVLLLVFAGLLLHGDFPVGRSPYGTLGRYNGAMLIRALHTYHDSIGAYPDSLTQIPPKYLGGYSFERSPGAPLLDYKRAGSDFELSFRFPGAGVTRCSYRDSKPEWNCRVGY